MRSLQVEEIIWRGEFWLRLRVLKQCGQRSVNAHSASSRRECKAVNLPKCLLWVGSPYVNVFCTLSFLAGKGHCLRLPNEFTSVLVIQQLFNFWLLLQQTVQIKFILTSYRDLHLLSLARQSLMDFSQRLETNNISCLILLVPLDNYLCRMFEGLLLHGIWRQLLPLYYRI